MTVRDLIKWLENQDDHDATVKVVVHRSGTGCYDQGGTASEENFTPELSDYTDFRGNRFMGTTDANYNQRYLLLGEIDGL